MQGRVLIAVVIAVAAGFVAFQLEPEPPAPRIVATEPIASRTVEIGGEIIPFESLSNRAAALSSLSMESSRTLAPSAHWYGRPKRRRQSAWHFRKR
jgi:hypothetical protein